VGRIIGYLRERPIIPSEQEGACVVCKNMANAELGGPGKITSVLAGPTKAHFRPKSGVGRPVARSRKQAYRNAACRRLCAHGRRSAEHLCSSKVDITVGSVTGRISWKAAFHERRSRRGNF
jgi:hypothetical protein